MKTKSQEISLAEKAGNAFDEVRFWLLHSWRLGSLMAKGAYLVGERRRLFQRLGEEIYYKVVKGEFAHADLEPLVRELDRLTKKVELEEMLIRGLRFGEGRHRRRENPEEEQA